MKKGLILCLICLTPALIFAAKVGVLHLKAVSVDPGMAEVVSGLLAGELRNLGYQVLNHDAMETAVGEKLQCYNSTCAATAGFKAKVDQVIFGSVSKLGEKRIVQVSVVKVSSQEIIWSGSLASKTAEDLDMVAKRLAKSIAEGKKPEETVEVGMVTKEEEKEPGRRKAFFITGGKFGTLLPMGGYGGSGALMFGAFAFWYELPNMAVELSCDIGMSGNLSEFDDGKAMEQIVDMSLLYFFSKTDFSPFVKGGAGMSFLSLYDDIGLDIGNGIGFGTNIGAGLVMFRTYDFRVLVEATYHVNFTDIAGYETPHHGPKFMLGLLYRTKRGGCGEGGCGAGCL